jgi:hypothetical protein
MPERVHAGIPACTLALKPAGRMACLKRTVAGPKAQGFISRTPFHCMNECVPSVTACGLRNRGLINPERPRTASAPNRSCRGNADAPACWSVGILVNLSSMNGRLLAVADRLLLSCCHSCMKDGMARRQPACPGAAYIPERKRERMHSRVKEGMLAAWRPGSHLPPADATLPPRPCSGGPAPATGSLSLSRPASHDLPLSSMLVGEERSAEDADIVHA